MNGENAPSIATLHARYVAQPTNKRTGRFVFAEADARKIRGITPPACAQRRRGGPPTWNSRQCAGHSPAPAQSSWTPAQR